MQVPEDFTFQTYVPMQTSMIASIDCVQSNVEDELGVSSWLNEIVWKTDGNIVNEPHELNAEEFAWFYLLPYGKNGLNQRRIVKISPLDYYQFQILGNEAWFRRNDTPCQCLNTFTWNQ